MMMTLTVNGRAHTVDVIRQRRSSCSQRRSRVERAEIRVRNGAVRFLHRDLEWPSHTFLRHARGNGGELGHHDARRSWHPGAAASDSAGVHRRAGCSVRILSQRRHSDGESASRPESEGDRAADPAGDVGRVVPLFHPHADDSCHHQYAQGRQSAGRASAEQEQPRQDGSESGRNA